MKFMFVKKKVYVCVFKSKKYAIKNQSVQCIKLCEDQAELN